MRKTAEEIVKEFNEGVPINDVSKRDLIDHLADLLKENERLKRRDFVVSMTNETLGRYVNERDERIKQLIESANYYIKLNHKNFDRSKALEKILAELPDKILQIDSWADIEELTFPLLDPTEEAQLEWFEEFCKRQADYIKDCFEEALAERSEETDGKVQEEADSN